MSLIQYAFEQELEKIAYYPKQLLTIPGRARRPYVRAGNRTVENQGAFFLPPPQLVKNQQEGVSEPLEALIPADVREAVNKYHKPGQVVLPGRKASDRQWGGLTADLGPMSKAESRQIRAFTVGHETAESKAKLLRQASPHANDTILANDINMLKRMQGPGAEGAKNRLAKVREYEFDTLRRRAVERFGPRAEMYFDINNPAKMPKKMQRILAESAPVADEDYTRNLVQHFQDRATAAARTRFPSRANRPSLAERLRARREGAPRVSGVLKKQANSMMGYGGMNTGGAQMTSPPSTGVTNMPGMSYHCDRCFCEIKQAVSQCPRCGGKISKVLDMKAIKQRLQGKPMGERQVSEEEDYKALPVGETGGEAAENEELATGAYSDTGKYASKKPEGFYSPIGAYKHLPRETKKLVALLSMGGMLYGVAKLRPIMKDIERQQQMQQQPKYAGVRTGRRGWNLKLRNKFPGSASAGLSKFRKSGRKYTSRAVAKPRF